MDDNKMNSQTDENNIKAGAVKKVRGLKKLLQEFKDFAMRGNMIDMAVGIVIGSAFTAMINSVVKDTVMPAISYFIGGTDYSDLRYRSILYGETISNIINFFILAAVVFIVVKAMNALANIAKKDAEKDKNVAVATELEVLQEIRDILKEKKVS